MESLLQSRRVDRPTEVDKEILFGRPNDKVILILAKGRIKLTITSLYQVPLL
jgi:hypothetical protein